MNKALREVLLEAVLPGLPPMLNRLYWTAPDRHRRKTKTGKEWQGPAVQILAAAWPLQRPYERKVRVEIAFLATDTRHWDAHSRAEALLDTLILAGVLKNKSQIKRLITMRYRDSKAKTVVAVEDFYAPRRSAIEGVLSAFMPKTISLSDP